MCFFFFQAEDGIRGLVRSRGLGDVYKRQLVIALRKWISLRSEPRTMVAADLAADFHLSELRPDLFALLDDIEGGRTKFLPGLKSHYGNLVCRLLLEKQKKKNNT